MRDLETFEESCEYRNQPERTFKPFVADILETDEIFQSVFCYVTDWDSDTADVMILMPIYVQPSAIRDDVSASLWSEYGLSLGTLNFKLAPQTFGI